ncbi:MAG: signal peptidase II [Bacteroidota bacterium]
MNVNKRLTRLSVLFIILCNIGCDQISKTIVRNEVGYYENIKVLVDNITLTKVENSGAFLSMGSFLPAFMKIALLIVLPLMVMLTGMYYILVKEKLSRLMVFGSAFIIGGGIGNLYDRILFGSVTDFLHIDFVIFQTGIFNMADVSIMSGMLLILISVYRNKIRLPVSQISD